MSILSFPHFFYERVNLNEPSFDILISLPQLEFHGKYNLKAKIALVLIQGQGELVGVAGESFSHHLKKIIYLTPFNFFQITTKLALD
jgi:hypothetical protein